MVRQWTGVSEDITPDKRENDTMLFHCRTTKRLQIWFTNITNLGWRDRSIRHTTTRLLSNHTVKPPKKIQYEHVFATEYPPKTPIRTTHNRNPPKNTKELLEAGRRSFVSRVGKKDLAVCLLISSALLMSCPSLVMIQSVFVMIIFLCACFVHVQDPIVNLHLLHTILDVSNPTLLPII